eukprot:6480570-Amphidinium_carterae.1
MACGVNSGKACHRQVMVHEAPRLDWPLMSTAQGGAHNTSLGLASFGWFVVAGSDVTLRFGTARAAAWTCTTESEDSMPCHVDQAAWDVFCKASNGGGLMWD